MHSHGNQRIGQYLRQHRVASIVAGPLIVITILSAFLFSNAGSELFGAFAKSPCSSGDRVYMVVSGDTLGAIAMRYNTTWRRLASYNTGVQTSCYSSPLRREEALDLSPEDATRYNLREGEKVTIAPSSSASVANAS